MARKPAAGKPKVNATASTPKTAPKTIKTFFNSSIN